MRCKPTTPIAQLRGEIHASHQVAKFLTEYLIALAQAFDGDLEQALILATLGQAQLSEPTTEPDRSAPCLTASAIAAMTAIPRQTVRRKLLVMQASGWVEQDDHRAWRLVLRDGRAVASSELKDFYRYILRRARQVVRAVQRSP